MASATNELPARDVCRILQPLFPNRVVSLALLNHYKTYCGIEPRGRENENCRRSRHYTLNDAIALAAALDLNDIGIPSKVAPKLLRALQGGVPPTCSGVVHQDSRYSVSYDHRPMTEAVTEAWNRQVAANIGAGGQKRTAAAG